LVVTSIVKGRGHVIGVVAVLTTAIALVSVPAAFGAVDGDPIATKTFKFKLSGKFKKQLKQNGVKMKPKKLKLTKGDIDPTTGQGDVRFGKVTFKKGNKKIVFNNLKGSMPGKVKANEGAIFKLTAPKVARNGFGADLSGIKFKFLKSAAKKVNRKLGLHSLKAATAAKATLSYQPETVKATGGTVFIDIPAGYLPTSGLGANTDPNTVANKQPAHCVDPASAVSAIAPGAFASLLSPNPAVGPLPTGVAARIKLPVTGGTIAPDGNDGVLQLAGGVRLASGRSGTGDALFPQPAGCANTPAGPTTSRSYLDTTNLAPNLGLGNVQSNAFIGGTNPGCVTTTPQPGCAIFAGDKGIAIGQALDKSAMTVKADPAAKTITLGGVLIRNNATSTTVLGGLGCAAPAGQPKGLFGNSTSPCNSSLDFADGDKFGISTLNATTR
jgi:hypothetical protein